MRSRPPTLLLGLVLLAAAGGLGCTDRPPPERPHARRQGPAHGPRIRVGQVLRLARAGVLEEVRQGAVRGVAARVPARFRTGAWQRAIDSQGNQFRVSPSGLLLTDGEPRPDREPASVANVAYYYTQAYSLMAARYRRQGLVMAAEVLDLPRADPSVLVAQRSLCALFRKLGITGTYRDKLYRNLVGVAHRVKAGALLQNHVHDFAVVVPLSWQVMANSSPNLGQGATAMAFAFRTGSAKTGRPANLLWLTRRPPTGTTLSLFARTRVSTTAGSAVRARPWKPLRAVGEIVAYEVYPVKYRGRKLRSLQLFFSRQGRFHHLNLLTAPAADARSARRSLSQVLRTFRVRPAPDPCKADGPARPVRHRPRPVP